MRFTTTSKDVLSQRSLMLRNYSGNMSAFLANKDETASITCNFIYRMQFSISIKIWFQGGQAKS